MEIVLEKQNELLLKGLKELLTLTLPSNEMADYAIHLYIKGLISQVKDI